MKINEIFTSIDGEGKRTGVPVIFIRLFGCNLRCSYCDTMYAVEGKDWKEMSVKDIIKTISPYGIKNVTLTGGEPLLHKDVLELLSELNKNQFNVNVETNGTIPVKKRWKRVFYTFDWKTKSSGMNDRMNLATFETMKSADVLKFVVGSNEDLDDAEDVVRYLSRKLKKDMPLVYVSPVFGSMEYRAIVEGIISRPALRRYGRFQVQLHKIIWEPNMRCV